MSHKVAPRPQIARCTPSVWGTLQLDLNVSACADEASGWYPVTVVGDINQCSRSEREWERERARERAECCNISNRARTEREISQVRMEGRGRIQLSGGCRALWENGHTNEGQTQQGQLHCKWADFVNLSLDESLKCCLLIKGGKTERNEWLKIDAGKNRRSFAHTAAVIAMKRLPWLLFTPWRQVEEPRETPWH